MRARVHRARYVWLGPGRVLAPGEIVVEGGRVRAVRIARGGRVPDRLLLPALVNAHVHLQLARLPRQVRRFVPWIRAVLAARRDTTDAAYERQAASALRRLVRDGVGHVGEIDSTGRSPAVLRSVPVGGRCYQELIGFDVRAAAARELVRRRRLPATRYCHNGLSPHAPYSVSTELLRAAVRSGASLTVHVAEAEEEVEFLRTGRGPFRELLEELGRLPKGFRGLRTSPVAWLSRAGALGPDTLLVHAQHVSRADEREIAASGSPVVVCPGTVRYFRRQVPPVARWLDLGIPVALGTDSPASNDAFSMSAELTTAHRFWPELSPETILGMATVEGGRALGRRSAGQLQPGAPASFLELRSRNSSESPIPILEQFVAGELPPPQRRAWLRGRRQSPGET